MCVQVVGEWFDFSEEGITSAVGETAGEQTEPSAKDKVAEEVCGLPRWRTLDLLNTLGHRSAI